MMHDMSRFKSTHYIARDYSEHDQVNHPPHYQRDGIECIQAIEAALTPEEFRGYCKGNVIKYTWREQYKGKDEDLAKSQWYLNRYLAKEKK